MSRVLVVATSRKTRGGITSVIKAHETGEQWKKYHCVWIQTHRDGPIWRKILYLFSAWIEFLCLLPFCDAVHFHAAAGGSARRKVPFAKLAKHCGKNVLVHFHPPAEKVLIEEPWRTPTYRLFDIADRLLVLSPRWKNLIRKEMPNLTCSIEVIYNPCPSIIRNHSDREEQYILFAGTITERKGYHWLLQAFAKICNDFPNWKLKYAGNGEIEVAKRMRVELKIPEQQIVFLGWISGVEKDRVFNNASIYCLPSWGEGFPMGVLDAIAYGVPVVTTPVGGVEDVLVDSVDCMISPVGDVEMLSQKLKLLMSDEVIRTNIVKNADIHLVKEFDIANINKQLERIYSEVCQN